MLNPDPLLREKVARLNKRELETGFIEFPPKEIILVEKIRDLWLPDDCPVVE